MQHVHVDGGEIAVEVVLEARDKQVRLKASIILTVITK